MDRVWFFVSRTLVVGLIGFTLGCQRETPDTRATDEQAIRAADAEWLKALQAKDLDHALSFYADDASLFPVSAPIATGKKAIRTNWAHLLAIPGFSLNWQITKVEVSRAGDLAYVQGTYEASFNDATGKPVTEPGKWVMVWKKQADGVWKAVAEIYNTDSPPPTHN